MTTDTLEGRVCTYCNEWKSKSFFIKSSWDKTGGYFGCKDCKQIINRKDHLKRRYGITVEEYASLLKSQGGTCALCDRDSAKNPFNKEGKLYVDHDHETGEIRGLLCNAHNTALGLVGDNVEGLERLLSYLVANKDVLRMWR